MTSTVTLPAVREIESGSNFEIYKGAQCLQRLDWTRDGAVRITHVGHIEAWCAERVIQRWDAFLRAKIQHITPCEDCWDATGYESGYRIACMAWTKAHPGAFSSGIHFLTRSKLLNMAVSVVSLALPGMVTGYSKRQDYDLVLRKLGLPVSITMPEFKPGI